MLNFLKIIHFLKWTHHCNSDMRNLKIFLNSNKFFYAEIAMISCLLFMIQGIGSFILLKDTTGKAGFDLFSDLSELTFILVLLAFLFYNALYSFKIMRNSNSLSEGEKVGKLGFILYCWSSFLVLTITVVASFYFSDVMRCCVSLFLYKQRQFFSSLNI